MADRIQATPRNALLGYLADAIASADAYAQRPDPTMPMGRANPALGVLSNALSIPAVAQTLDRLSYGEPLTTGSGWTTRARPEAVEAAMTLAPVAAAGARYTGKAANALADFGVRKITGNPLATATGVLDYAARMKPATPATVWHGSPHKFDAFDSSKIGTGEGAQAYGHGIYFAESPDVAASYIQSNDKLSVADYALRSAGGDVRKARRGLLEQYQKARANYLATINDGPALAEIFGDPRKRIVEGLIGLRNASIYKVDLPDSTIAKMLDWDKPLSEQAPEVQAAINKLGIHDASDGADLYWKLKRTKYGVKESMPASPMAQEAQSYAAELMRKQGIPGIRYLDGGSRGAGQGTSNFVVFPGEENALTILERNGVKVR